MSTFLHYIPESLGLYSILKKITLIHCSSIRRPFAMTYIKMVDLCAQLGFCKHDNLSTFVHKSAHYNPLTRCRSCGKPSALYFMRVLHTFKKGYETPDGRLPLDLAQPDPGAFQEMTDALFEAHAELKDMY